MEYSNTKFMMAIEKEKVVKQFDHFIKTLIKNLGDNDKCFRAFTKGIYEHCHLHCGFIAHYNRHGFYQTYFGSQNIDDLKNFINHFIDKYDEINVDCSVDYKDIGEEMAKIIIENSEQLVEKFGRQTESDDRETITFLMKKHNIKEIEVL